MYNKPLIFVDTEFSSLDPYKGEILSIGLVKENGEELYLELDYRGQVDPWVKENIIPDLVQPKISQKIAISKISKFVGTKKPVAVSFVNQYDTIYIYKLFSQTAHPFFWLPLDFASMLYAIGYNPLWYSQNMAGLAQTLDIDISRFRPHNALDDARILRLVYQALEPKLSQKSTAVLL